MKCIQFGLAALVLLCLPPRVAFGADEPVEYFGIGAHFNF